jgi:hypothetical protein
VAADEDAAYPAGEVDRIVYLDIQVAVAGRFAACPGGHLAVRTARIRQLAMSMAGPIFGQSGDWMNPPISRSRDMGSDYAFSRSKENKRRR